MSEHYQFLKRWYKHSRFEGRGKHYAEMVTKASDDYLKKNGYAFISCHESNTGQAIKYNTKFEILGDDAPPVEYQRKKGHITHLF